MEGMAQDNRTKDGDRLADRAVAKAGRIAQRRALDAAGLPTFEQRLRTADLPQLSRRSVEIVQLNVGLYCNQACNHCHVDSSPLRTETMDRATAERVVRLLEKDVGSGRGTVTTLDLTGGAPEYNESFRYLVTEARRLGLEVIDRCNLTVLCEPGFEDLAQFLADNQVRVVASLPCYTEGTVDDQRGRGVFDRSIRGLRELNAKGYGEPQSGLTLDLVYNPSGASLPPPQASLQEAYKSELSSCYGIAFDSLLALTNMPIKRFADQLHREKGTREYLELLVGSFNPSAVDGVMCTNTVSVRYDGALFDCDFNQQLDMASGDPQAPRTIFDVADFGELAERRVAVDAHCYGCTAGAGSGCQGSTV